MYFIEREDKEIDELLNACANSEAEGRSKFPGMTYEQGIQAAIRWMTDKEEINPLED